MGAVVKRSVVMLNSDYFALNASRRRVICYPARCYRISHERFQPCLSQSLKLLSHCALCGALFTHPQYCSAALQRGEWAQGSSLVAEVWRSVDSLYLDRSFNGMDWFQLRQDALSQDLGSEETAARHIQDMLGLLEDRYTRYLTPAQYEATLFAATGQLVGIGVELERSASYASFSEAEGSLTNKDALCSASYA